MNTEAISATYTSDERFRPFFDHFANRQKNYAETKVNRLKQVLENGGDEVSRGLVIEFFRKLETLECGQFVVGRRGWESRFLWSVNMVDVGRAAAGESDEIEELPAADDEESIMQADEMLQHSFHLRPDCVISFSLPSDLTDREAERIAGFIQSIPFED